MRFFTNAIDTRTLGVDVVANYGFALGATSTVRLTGGYNYNVNRVLRVAPTPAALSAFQETLFDRVERARIEVGQPKSNFYLGGVFSYQDFGLTLRTQRFGEVTSFGTPTDGSLDQTFAAKWITDVNASYTFGIWSLWNSTSMTAPLIWTILTLAVLPLAMCSSSKIL